MKRSGIKFSIMMIVTAVLLGCGGGSASEDPEARLNELVQQRDEINRQITELRKQLHRDQGNSGEPDRALLVLTRPVHVSRFDHFLEVQGNVESDTNIQVPYRTSGIIEQVLVEEGDKVKKGDLLVRLDSAVLERGLEELESALSLSTTVFERTKRLWDRNIGSEIDYLTAKNEKERLEKQIETQKEQIRLTRIFSPIDGTVDDVISRVGEAAVMGQGAVRIVKLSELTIRAALSETFVGAVKVGDPVSVSFPSLGRKLDLSISAVGRVVDKDNRTFNIEINVPDTETHILPNLTAVLTVNDYSVEQAIVIPTKTLQKTEGQSFVFLAVRDGSAWRAERRFVDKGLYFKNMTEIRRGLEPGEHLVTAGFQNLADGQLLQVRTEDGE